MCGLFGTFGPGVCSADVRVFYEGIQTIFLRGPHSTGIGFWDTHHPGLDWIKTAQNSVDFLQNKEVRKKLEGIKDPLVLMGHARFATRGAITSKNAHPFQHKKVLLAMNGTLQNITGMNDFNKYEVDSDAASWHMNEYGLIPTLKSLQGPFALTWLDGNKRTFNIVRNYGRDLFYAKHPHRATWYYSSEAKHLDWILTRNENNVNKREWDIKEVKPHTLLQYRFDDRGILHVVDLDKELFPNFHHRSSQKEDNTHAGVGADTRSNDDVVLSGADLDEQFREHLERARDKWDNYRGNSPNPHPNIIELGPRRRSYGHFDGPKGPPEKYLREEYGVSVNDWIRVKLIEFNPYAVSKDPNHGKAVGEFDSPEAPDVYINAHSIDLNKWKDKKFTPGYYACRVSAITWVDQHESYAIHVNEYKPISEMPNIGEPVRVKKDVVPPAFNLLSLPNRTFKPEPNSPMQKCPVGMTKQEFGRLTAKGCTLCRNNLHHHKKDKVYFALKIHPLCDGCYNQYRHEARMDDQKIAERVITLVANRMEEEESRKKREEAAAKRLIVPADMN